MKFKKVLHIVSLALLVSTYTNAAEVENKNGFALLQDNKTYKGEEVTMARKSFTIVSPHQEFAFVVSKEPINMLDNNKEILKLIGTGEAFSKGNALLYKKSDLLDNYHTCDVYYGNIGKGCKKYIEKKVMMGLKDKLVYTFGAFYIEPKEWLVKRINEVEISKTKGDVYYLYLFEETDRVGEVSVVQHVTRMKINIK